MSDRGPGFRPPWWATLGTLLLGGLLVTAGFWQLSRAADKRELFTSFDAGAAARALAAPDADADLEALRYQPIRAEGHFDASHQVLLDARTRDGRAGYEVLTPLVGGGTAVLVNRGWVQASPDRRRLPDIGVSDQPRSVTGRLDRLPQAALASSPTEADPAAAWPRRLLFPTAADIGGALGYPVAEYQLLLAADEPDGFVRLWRPAVLTPAEHVGYAVQWFALATALVVIYIVLNRRQATADPKKP
jgi:surfeit locus 1 family protein